MERLHPKRATLLYLEKQLNNIIIFSNLFHLRQYFPSKGIIESQRTINMLLNNIYSVIYRSLVTIQNYAECNNPLYRK